jgi:zinc protease
MTHVSFARLVGATTLLALVVVAPVRTRAQAATAAKPATAPAAPAAALPSADEILKRYRTAIGGEAAIRKHTSRTIAGTFEIVGQNMKGDLKIHAAAPDLLRLAITLPGVGDIERGYDGHIGWSIDQAVGPRLLEGKELDELKHSADFYDDLHDPKSYSAITVVGLNPFEGADCYEMKLVRTTGFEYTEFFNAKTGLLAGMKMNATSQMGTTPVVQIVAEYKNFGGVLVPTVTRQRMMQLESQMTITSVVYDQVDPKLLAVPPQIAALVKQQH